MNATSSMGIAAAATTVRPCCRILAARLFPKCPRGAAPFPMCPRKSPSPFPKCPRRRRRPHLAPAWIRAAVAPAADAAAPGRRRLSTTVDPRGGGGDKGFERIYIQGIGGAAVKPIVIERPDAAAPPPPPPESAAERVEEEAAAAEVREETAMEREAWGLLRGAVVRYCGSPVGTVAASDVGAFREDPLNYDQVFIRDFVPSALAFLLKGETEIVRNFLLHTLQLQVRLAIHTKILTQILLLDHLGIGW